MSYAIRKIKDCYGDETKYTYRNETDEKEMLNDIFKRLVEVFDCWLGSKNEYDVVEVE